MRIAVTAVVSCCLLALCAPAALADPGSPSQDARIERSKRLFRGGVAAYQSGDLNEALDKLLAAHRSWRSPALAFNIARVLERMGEAEAAISWFRVYLEHGSPSVEEQESVQARIADLAALGERHRKQIFIAAPSSQRLTEEAQTFFERGIAMFNRGQLLAAMQAFQAAYRFSRLPEILYNMAVTAERLDRLEEAYTLYNDYLDVRPDDAQSEAIAEKISDLRRQMRRQ